MYNSDGYVMIDMKDVNMSQSSQHITGIYDRVVSVIDTNKLALIINAGSNTPMAAVVHKRLNYYVINTTLYIFTINSNDIVIVEEAGTATVDVEIVPTLTEGVKVADFAIGTVEGSIYAPAQQSEINDNVTASNTTWSSDKIDTELSAKADSSSLATVATTGDYSDLSGTPTIPVLTDLIDDSTEASNKVWSSDKTAAEIAAGVGVTIDDTTTSLTKTWSSDKINSEISAKPSINDTTASSSAVYSSDKIDTLLSAKADTATTYTKTEVDTALSAKANIADVDNNTVSITKINQSAFDLVATRRGHTVILTFDGALPSGTYGDIWQCSLTPTVGVRALVAWGSSFTLIDIDTNGIIKFRSSKTISEGTYIGGELVFVTPS